MPFAQIHVIAGQSEERKKQLIARTSQAIAEVMEVPLDRVRIAIQEVPLDNWGIGGRSMKELFPHLAATHTPDKVG
jgi:4-oxalocrotonate tautomerase